MLCSCNRRPLAAKDAGVGLKPGTIVAGAGDYVRFLTSILHREHVYPPEPVNTRLHHLAHNRAGHAGGGALGLITQKGHCRGVKSGSLPKHSGTKGPSTPSFDGMCCETGELVVIPCEGNGF
jgi:hypothetical protein